MTKCAYCSSKLEHYTPVHVTHDENEMSFCNYACLSSYITENNLTQGNCCRVDY